MSNITRKQFLEGITAGWLASFWSPSSDALAIAAPAAGGRLLIPYPARPWTQSTRLVGDRPQLSLAEVEGRLPDFSRLPLYNDFSLVSDAAGRWHCIGILFEGASAKDFRQDRLFHYVADRVQGPYHSIGYVDLGYGRGSGVWAPFILRERNRTLMFYAARAEHDMSIRVAEAIDPNLRSWRRGVDGVEIIVQERHARDPQIIHDEHRGIYVLYFIASVRSDAGWQDVVWFKTSTDLLSWSDPRTLLGVPPGYKAAESVFVLQRNGYYYMWVSGHDYSHMSLYISTDPFNFGDAAKNRIEEQPGHASEIVRAAGRYWMACVAIASVPGLPSGPGIPVSQHDLEGVYIQPLEWRKATPEMLNKVVGARH
jgi:hypothetical protein